MLIHKNSYLRWIFHSFLTTCCKCHDSIFCSKLFTFWGYLRPPECLLRASEALCGPSVRLWECQEEEWDCETLRVPNKGCTYEHDNILSFIFISFSDMNTWLFFFRPISRTFPEFWRRSQPWLGSWDLLPHSSNLTTANSIKYKE